MVLMAAVAWGKPEHYPLISHADLPLYPPLARALNLTGTVEIQLLIAKGIVTDAQVKSVAIDCHNCAPLTDEGKEKVGNYLSPPSLANIKTGVSIRKRTEPSFWSMFIAFRERKQNARKIPMWRSTFP
jgi:hypothetical protein